MEHEQTAILKEIQNAVMTGSAQKTKEWTEKAIIKNVDFSIILSEGLITGMAQIGSKFKNGEVYVPEVLIAAHAMHAGMSLVKPHLIAQGVQEKGVVVIGTVKGDLHDIGKNLVVMMLEGAGYKVVDLGIDVSTETFINAITEFQPNIIALSALLTTTMEQMKETVDKIKSNSVHTKILVGGAPITQKFSDEIGADAYAPDAARAVEKADSLMSL